MEGISELIFFHRLENQFTMTPDMRPSTKLLFCRKIIIIINWLNVEMLTSEFAAHDFEDLMTTCLAE